MPSDADASPRFELKTFFDGPIRAYGLFQGRSGQVLRRFHANILGIWDSSIGTLHEYFTYLDGAPRQQRIWNLRQTGSHAFEGTGQGSAGDILGTARGQSDGFSLHWVYDVALPVRGKLVEVHFDDWMYMLDANTVLNRSVITKFGVRVGEATLAFHRLPATAENVERMNGYPCA